VTADRRQSLLNQNKLQRHVSSKEKVTMVYLLSQNRESICRFYHSFNSHNHTNLYRLQHDSPTEKTLTTLLHFFLRTTDNQTKKTLGEKIT
jgi:hypothetical protein